PLHSLALSRYLPSFPTRRSSDLIDFRRLGELLDAVEMAQIARADLSGGCAIGLHGSGVGECAAEDRGQHARGEAKLTHCQHDHRSEEHTSELQSRVDLVCRLLLE